MSTLPHGEQSSAESILQAYEHLKLHDGNEAATRLKVIDRILRDVLNWTDSDIHPEEHVSEDLKNTFADYILRTANAAIVVEAKKVGITFEVKPAKRRERLTKTYVSGELGNAITQARDYARKLGIDYAVVTNGSTWIIFPAQRHDQVAFQDSTAIVFSSLDDCLRENYQEFVDLLGRDAVISGSIDIALLGRNQDQLADRKLRNYFASPHRTPRTNPIYPAIQSAIVTAFTDSIIDLSADQLERCYVAVPEAQKFDNKIRMHVAKREAVVNKPPLRALKSQDAEKIERKIVSAQRSDRPLAMLVLGTVGAGKTTFLHYLRKVRLKSSFEKSESKPYPHWVHINFLEKYPGGDGSKFIYEQLFDYIKTDQYLRDFDRCVKFAYHDEIESLKSGPLSLLASDPDRLNERITDLLVNDYTKITPYVDKVLTYSVRHAPFFLIIDNVDQIEDESVQSRLFTEALSIARHLSLNLILAIRQSTYVRHRNSPAIDAFDFEIAQIDPPRISSVLSKRFSLAKMMLDGVRGEFTAENGAHVKVENLSEIIDLVQGSVLGTEIGKLIEVLATDDVRLALRMTREFLERGYTNPGRALEFYRKTGRYVLPRHEAFRAIILGTNNVYNEELSSIGNPFDSKLSIQNAQLLRLFILTAIVNYASANSFRAIDGSTIGEMLRRIGFGDAFTQQVLVDLCLYRFLFTAGHGAPSLTSSFVPSRLGGYVVRDLLAYMPFLENMLFDTYISNAKIWNELRDLSSQIASERQPLKRVRLRIRRVVVFFKEMENLYAPLFRESSLRGLPSEWCHNPFEERKNQLHGELKRVIRSARKNYPIKTTKIDDIDSTLDELAGESEADTL